MRHIPQIIGHRGTSRLAPENTLTAFRLAWEEGADGIEADFRLTRDGQIVCVHDASTHRTTGLDLAVADATLDELWRLDAGAWKGARWNGERIPVLAEVLALCPPGKHLFLEIKSGCEIIPALERELAGLPALLDRLTLLSFDASLLALLRRRLPDVRVCWLTAYRRAWRSRAVRPSPVEILDVVAQIGAEGLASQAHETLDAEFLAVLRNAGMAVHVWTVDLADKARHYADLGVDSIMTNRPGWLRRQLADRLESR
jgi:glycerophosphoryl diester phosphodiesterase